MANYYYLTDERKPIGPIDLEQLRDLGHQGVVRGDTYVAKEGDPQWRRYAEANLPTATSATPIPIPPLSEPSATPSALNPKTGAQVQAAAGAKSGADAASRKPRWWLWVPLGLAGFACLLTAIGLGALFFWLGPLRSSEPYIVALSRVQNNPQAVELLGGPPVQAGWLVKGEVPMKNAMGDETGTAKLSIPVKGQKESGTLAVVGNKRAGVWIYSQLDLTAKGQTIDLRAEQEKAQAP